LFGALAAATLLFTSAVTAGGWTTYNENSGNIEFVEVVRTQGFLVKGS